MPINPKQQVRLIIYSTVLSLFSLFSTINFTDPFSSGLLTHLFFYISLFVATLGFFTLSGLGIRQFLFPGHYFTNFKHSFRQGILLGALILIFLILLSKNLLFWWVGGSIILFLITVETFFNLKV